MRLIYRIITVIFLLVSTKFGSGEYDCPVERCKEDGPEIQFPFRLKDRHPEHCGYPGFDLYCSQSNETVLKQPVPVQALASASLKGNKLPQHFKFIVDKIDYMSQLVLITNIDVCFPGLKPASPFKYYSYIQQYPFFNCSSTRRGNIPDDSLDNLGFPYYKNIPINNLDNFGYHVYAAGSYNPRYAMSLSNCTKIFDNSLLCLQLRLHDPSYPVALSWDDRICRDCAREGKYCRLMNNSIYYTECFTKHAPGTCIPKRKIIKVVIGLAVMGLVIFVLHRLYMFKKMKGYEKRIEQFLEDHKASRPSRYSYADIKKITDDFKEKLGKGGFGTVYKGKLSNDVLVAVKVLDNFKGNGEDFINEVGTIGRIHHVNVVRLLGYCADGFRRGLVYEFLPNNSLEKFISLGNQSRSLGWEKMQQIGIGIAKGLDYLHQGCNQRILHFDIKPHNILLDQNFNPKVADFGLAKLCSKEESIVSMTAARGTIGYIAPEVFSRNYGNVSYKADIYSFGMLLLDMVGGRKNFHGAVQDESEVYFPEWMYNQLEKGEEIGNEIEKEEDNKIFKKLVVVGLWCIQWHPAGRPSLKAVIQMLEGDDIPIMPPNPFGSAKSPATNSNGNATMARSKFFNGLEIISEAE